MPINSQRSQVYLSKQSIKRSLKTKLKLIEAENKILVDTINGYVKRAEAVYAKLENATDITPKQFSKAMAKLETVYSACVKLILVTTDLFDDDDKSELTSESSTKVSDSMASMEMPDSDHSGPDEIKQGAAWKKTNKRMKKLELRFHDFVARKEMASHGSKATQSTKETLKNVQMGKQSIMPPKRFENLYRPDVSGDLDNFIEFQRFLYGLDSATSHDAQKAGGERLRESEGKGIADIDAVNRSIPEQATDGLKQETNVSSPPYREAEDGDLQSSIIKKLENLEMAIYRMSKCVQGNPNGPSTNEETQSVGHAKFVIDPCKSQDHIPSPTRISGNARHEDISEMSSPTFSQPSRNAYGKRHFDWCKNVPVSKSARIDQPSFPGTYHNFSQETLGKFGSSLNAPRKHPLFFCPCQYSSCLQESEPTRQHPEAYYPSNKLSVLRREQDTDFDDIRPLSIAEHFVGTPNASAAQANPDKPVALDSKFTTQERDEMVNKIVEMVSAQLLPHLTGHDACARNPEQHQDDASFSNVTHSTGHQIRRTRPLSAPNIKWPERQNNFSPASLTRICDNMLTQYLQPKEDAAPAPQVNLVVQGNDQSTIPTQKQTHSLAPQLFYSATKSQESKQPTQISTNSYHSIQQQMHELRASLDDFHSKQHLQYKPNLAGRSSPVRPAIFDTVEEQVDQSPAVTLQNRFVDTTNVQRLRRSSSRPRDDLKSIEPLTIEIHDYQHVGPAQCSSSPDKRFCIEKEKAHFRQHAKSFMHQQKVQEKSITSYSPKDDERLVVQVGGKYASDRNKQALDSEENLDSEDSYKNREADSLERHVHFHYSYPCETVHEAVVPKEESCNISSLACRGRDRGGCLVQMKLRPSVPKNLPEDNKVRLGDQQNKEATVFDCSGAKCQTYQEPPPYEDGRGSRIVDSILPCKDADSRDADYVSHELQDVTNNLSQIKNHDDSRKTCIRGTKTICVSNLPQNIEEIKLLYLLKPHGHVTKIYFIKHRTTGAFQGIAYIKFSKEEDAQSAATALHKTNIDGHIVYARLHSQGK